MASYPFNNQANIPHMKKNGWLMIGSMLLTSLGGFGQTLSPQTVNTSGAAVHLSGIQLEYSIGGLVTQASANSTVLLTQDFLQPYASDLVVDPEDPGNPGGGTGGLQLASGSGVDNAGTTFINEQAIIDFTVGEAVSMSLEAGSTLLTQGILQPFTEDLEALPVLGMEFTARRLNPAKVQLKWSTEQEFNNEGFTIQRKKETATDFESIHFKPSAAPNGNSLRPLHYTYVDQNNYSGKTMYRIKQEDFDGRFMYSTVELVAGMAGKQLDLKVWPIPSAGPVNVQVVGIKSDIIRVYDSNGRLVQQQVISENSIVQINALRSGIYLLQLVSQPQLTTKIIIQK
jgi:hypothetical protein